MLNSLKAIYMIEKFTQEQLTQIVAEIDRLSRQQEAELDREQVKDILQQLNLSPDLLDDAIVQVQRRQALLRQQRRNRWIGLGLAITLIGVIILVPFFRQNQQQKFANIAVYSSRLTFSQDNNDNLKQVNRYPGSEIFYRLTLQNAPVGSNLSLSCNWIDPTGQIAHQNRYQTQTIDKEVWNTHCRYTIGTAAMAGQWQVEMKLGDKILSRNTFEVK
jgi:hypothetical protein